MAKKEKMVREARFSLKKGQTLYVSVQSGLSPGLDRIYVENTGKTAEVVAYGAHAKFRFVTGGSGKPGQPNFEILSLTSAETLEEILKQKFWGQFTFGRLFKYAKDKNFNRIVNRQIKKLVRDFEAKAAQQLNSIPKPSRK